MTYSIVARDSETGQLGVAIQSHWFSVGSIVGWAEAGVGAAATQALVNPALGPEGLELLKAGKTPGEALRILLDADAGRALRQVGIVSARGEAAAHTGARCMAAAGHLVGDGFSVQANMMLSDTVWPAMAEAFSAGREPFAERLVAALEAAQAEGGDIRGQQSAALVVVRGETTGKPWDDRLVDLRVDDHPAPVEELKRLLRVHRAYEHMNAGDQALEADDAKRALQEYGAAEALLPDSLEIRYWHAISLANLGRLDEALPVFKSIFVQDANWRTLTERLPAAGILSVDEAGLAAILAQG
ncbi:MAG: DUF1028 domain-containing protein [Anaerolineae bacterium]|nr:DUF1028 domain-containing protein [Anaerolineae bacterium]